VSPTVCNLTSGDAFSGESITICYNDSCDNFVQVGWIARQNHGTAPQMYCEYYSRLGGTDFKFFFPTYGATHNYSMTYDSPLWTCRLDGVFEVASNGAAFSAGAYHVVQGETNSTHTQIGLNSPLKLFYSSMQHRRAATGLWSTFDPDPANNIADSPYGVDEPATAQFRNWTNAH
jgi:hypothetical protein